MRKKLYTFVIFIILTVVTSSACNTIVVNPSITQPVIAKSIDKATSKPLEPVTHFKQSDSIIYFTVKVNGLPKDTKLKAIWKYLGDGTEIPSEMTTQGTGYEAFNLKKGTGPFPVGRYTVTVTSTINNQSIEVKGEFVIEAEVEAVHLLNPVMTRSIDNEDKLNPVEITSQFTQSDTIIYIIIQSKDLPKDTTVSCVWLYRDTGDNLSHKIISDGSRNIAFNLKPNEGQKLPPGKYLVTVSAVINNGTESVSKEFEIIKASD